jgi:hypothetical protein
VLTGTLFRWRNDNGRWAAKSINVKIIGGSLMVQHYIEEMSRPDHLRLVSDSDVFTPSGRTMIVVTWDRRVEKIDDRTCELTNTVHRAATPELLQFLAKQGIPFDVFRTARRPMSEAHNRQELSVTRWLDIGGSDIMRRRDSGRSVRRRPDDDWRSGRNPSVRRIQ